MADPRPPARPRLAVSLGDPVGIGPEVTCRALLQGAAATADVTLHGDAGAVRRALKVIGADPAALDRINVRLHEVTSLSSSALAFGHPSLETGLAQARFFESAARSVIAGEADALVTGPIHKAWVARAGFDVPGQTEWAASLCGVERTVMMLAGPRIRVLLVTTHLALRAAVAELTTERIVETARIAVADLRRWFGLEHPRLAVCALNPHAGEEGRFGDEETRLIAPAVEAMRALGIEALGPLPTDTLFVRAAKGEFDAVVCHYHDQGLVPLKLAHFDEAINVTLGLPFLRTSPDHGTAYDLAGTGKASERSMALALLCASKRRLPGA
jgi:4-hydroxythreonine-4-phosphate dehydrogenase